MSALIGVSIFLIPGFLAARLWTRSQGLRGPIGLALALSFPLGAGAVSLILFFSFLAAGAFGPHLSYCLYALLTAFLMYLNLEGHVSAVIPRLITTFSLESLTSRIKKISCHFSNVRKNADFWIISISALILLAALADFWQYYWRETVRNPLGGWDARYFWKLKAAFYFRTPSEWMGMFSPLPGDWSHPDYPLLWPGTFAGFWFAAGKETLAGPVLASLCFSLSLLGLIFWYLWHYASRAAALLAAAFLTTIYMWRFWATALYADIPLSFFITSAGIMLVLALRTSGQNLFSLAGFLAGLALWTKDEGIFFMGWILGVMVLTFWTEKIAGKEGLKRILSFLMGASICMAAALTIKVYLGTSGGQYLGSGRTLADYGHLLFGNPGKSQVIAAVMAVFFVSHAQWNGLWILFAASALTGGKEAFRDRRWIFFLLVVLIELGYFIILHLTPHDLKFQIETALLRIMSHAMGLALIFAIEAHFSRPEPALK